MPRLPVIDQCIPLLGASEIVRRGPNGDHLLDGIDFELNAGERWAVSGPSGSGKTLFLRALAMLDPLTSGQVRWRGEPVSASRVPLFRSHVAYVSQRPALIDGDVDDNLAYPYALAARCDHRYDRSRIERWLVELDRDASFLDKSTRSLSGGEAQLVALLRTLQLDPEVLLLDEPTAALDETSAGCVEGLLQQWIEAPAEKRSYVWISHDTDQARRIASRRLTMRGGVIETASLA